MTSVEDSHYMPQIEELYCTGKCSVKEDEISKLINISYNSNIILLTGMFEDIVHLLIILTILYI